jgi:MFS family permease
MDQLGAVAGPLLLAGVLASSSDDYRIAFAALGLPGVVLLGVLVWLRLRVPDPLVYEAPALAEPAAAVAAPSARGSRAGTGTQLPARFWGYVAAVAVLSCGVASFPLLAFHAQTRHLVSDATVPVLFAVAMLVDGIAGLVIGSVYDRRGPTVLLAVPIGACGAALAFADSAWLVWMGVAIWGVVNGVLDSTVKAAVTAIVPAASRALAFGWLSLMRGLALLVAGGILGVAYDRSITLTIALILVANALAFVGLARVVRRAA